MRPATIALAAAAAVTTVVASDASVDVAADLELALDTLEAAEAVPVADDEDAAVVQVELEGATAATNGDRFPHNPPHHTKRPSGSSASAHKTKTVSKPAKHTQHSRAIAIPCPSSSSSHPHPVVTKTPCPTMTTKKHPMGTGSAVPCPTHGGGHQNVTAPGGGHHGGNGTHGGCPHGGHGGKDCGSGGPKPTGPKDMPPTTGAGVSDKVVPVVGSLVAVAVAFMFL